MLCMCSWCCGGRSGEGSSCCQSCSRQGLIKGHPSLVLARIKAHPLNSTPQLSLWEEQGGR